MSKRVIKQDEKFWSNLLKEWGGPSGWTVEDLIARQIRYDENILDKLRDGLMSEEDAATFLSDPYRSTHTYPWGPDIDPINPAYEHPVSEETLTEDDLLDVLFKKGAVSEEIGEPDWLKPKYQHGGKVDAGEYADERGWGEKIIDYLLRDISPSKFMSAHKNIDKLIANADEKAELAKLFEFTKGSNVIAGYRHLDPADSTVNLVYGLIDKYTRDPEFMLSEDNLLYKDASRRAERGDFLTKEEAAKYLVQARNE